MLFFIALVSALQAQEVRGAVTNVAINAHSVSDSALSPEVHADIAKGEGGQRVGAVAKTSEIKRMPGANRLAALFAAHSVSKQAAMSSVTALNAFSLSDAMTQPNARGIAAGSSICCRDITGVENRFSMYPRLGQFPDSTRGTALLSPPLYADADIFKFRPSSLRWVPHFAVHPLLNPSYMVAAPVFLLTTGEGGQPSSLGNYRIQSPEQKLKGLSNLPTGSELSNPLMSMSQDESIDGQIK